MTAAGRKLMLNARFKNNELLYMHEVDALKANLEYVESHELPNRAIHTGYLKDGKRHGPGISEYSHGLKITANWEHDAAMGEVECVWPDKSIYRGEFEGGFRHGYGTMTQMDGSVYEGYFENGHRHGKGKLTFKNGASHEGDWRMNQFHGYGVTTYTNGSKHEGLVIDGKKNGRVIYTAVDGTKREEEWSVGVQIR